MNNTHTPEGLVPAGDGTYYGPGCNVPLGWHWRWRVYSDWFDVSVYSSHRYRFVQCRPVPEPEPRTERVPWHQAVGRRLLPSRSPVTRAELHEDRSVTLWAGTGSLVLPGGGVDGMVEVLVEDDPADTGGRCSRCGGRGCDGCGDEERIVPGVSAPVAAEGDDTGGRWKVTAQQPVWASADGRVALSLDFIVEMGDPGQADFAAAWDDLTALVRDARPLPDAETVWYLTPAAARLTITQVHAVLDAVAAVRDGDQ